MIEEGVLTMSDANLPVVDRFAFQASHVASAAMREMVVLNVGSDEDPAGLARYSRTINCDVVMKRNVHLLMDMTKPWPLCDNFAGMVVFGDVLEHLSATEILHALREARRVASELVVTVPEETRGLTDPAVEPIPRNHCTLVTRPLLERLLAEARWDVAFWLEVDYGFVPRGHLVHATARQ